MTSAQDARATIPTTGVGAIDLRIEIHLADAERIIASGKYDQLLPEDQDQRRSLILSRFRREHIQVSDTGMTARLISGDLEPELVAGLATDAFRWVADEVATIVLWDVEVVGYSDIFEAITAALESWPATSHAFMVEEPTPFGIGHIRFLSVHQSQRLDSSEVEAGRAAARKVFHQVIPLIDAVNRAIDALNDALPAVIDTTLRKRDSHLQREAWFIDQLNETKVGMEPSDGD